MGIDGLGPLQMVNFSSSGGSTITVTSGSWKAGDYAMALYANAEVALREFPKNKNVNNYANDCTKFAKELSPPTGSNGKPVTFPSNLLKQFYPGWPGSPSTD